MALPSLFRGFPNHPAADPFGSVDRLFDELWRNTGTSPVAAAATGFVPRLDVVEREAEYVVTAELPGLEEKDFQLEVHGDVLTLRGEKRSEHEEEHKGVSYRERSYGSFRRSVRLPAEVRSDQASASFKNGVLAVTLPKAESARVRQIPVTPA